MTSLWSPPPTATPSPCPWLAGAMFCSTWLCILVVYSGCLLGCDFRKDFRKVLKWSKQEADSDERKPDTRSGRGLNCRRVLHEQPLLVVENVGFQYVIEPFPGQNYSLQTQWTKLISYQLIEVQPCDGLVTCSWHTPARTGSTRDLYLMLIENDYLISIHICFVFFYKHKDGLGSSESVSEHLEESLTLPLTENYSPFKVSRVNGLWREY